MGANRVGRALRSDRSEFVHEGQIVALHILSVTPLTNPSAFRIVITAITRIDMCIAKLTVLVIPAVLHNLKFGVL